MKTLEWIKIFTKNHIKKKSEFEYSIELNNKKIDGIKVISNNLHSTTMKILRTFKTQQYNIFYLMKKKKGFNTLFFEINYDILVADRNGKIINLFIDQKQGYISNHFNSANFIYFMPVGSIKFHKFEVNNKLNLIAKWVEELS